MSLWLPGDFLLTRPATFSAYGISALIFATQLQRFPGRDAQWTHAALYVGDGRVIEAEFSLKGDGPSGIVAGQVASYGPEYVLRVRRDNRLLTSQRTQMVDFARNILGQDYSVARGIELFFRACGADITAEMMRVWLAGWPQRPASPGPPQGGFVCSDVVAAAYADATGRNACPGIDVFMSPAALSDSNEFGDLPVAWCQVA